MAAQKVEVSFKTILYTIFLILSLIILWQIKDLVFSLFIAFIIAGALKPVADRLERYRIPRTLGVIFVYLLFILLIFNAFALIIPPLAIEMIHLFKNLPNIIKSTFPEFTKSLNFDFLSQYLPGITNQTFGFIRDIFSNVVFVTSTLFFGFYMTVEKNLTEKLLGNFFKQKDIKRVSFIIEKAERRTSAWFWGEALLMFVVGIMSYIGLNLIGVKYALALAVLAGLLEVIPTLGPIMSAIPAILIGLSHSALLAVLALAVCFVVQQLENNLIVPIIMKRVVGIHPVVIMTALIVGGKLAGIIGVLLSVPAIIFVEAVIIEIKKQK